MMMIMIDEGQMYDGGLATWVVSRLEMQPVAVSAHVGNGSLCEHYGR